MKKIIYTIISTIFLISCNSIPIVKTNNSGLYTKSIAITDNTINEVKFENNVDFTNDEINNYYIKKLIVQNSPIVKMDINFEKAYSDMLIIDEVKGDKFLFLEFNIIGKAKTTKFNIPFIVTPKDVNLNIMIRNEKFEIDNTVYEIATQINENMKIWYLKPVFLDENTFTEKQGEDVDRSIEKSKNKENAVILYSQEVQYNDKTYVARKLKIGKGTIVKGKSSIGSLINVKRNDRLIASVKTDENGTFSTYIPYTNGKVEVYEIRDGKTTKQVIELGGK